MAKSKAFFGLRRGSTKSHTYQVYRGEQVTKDRVTKVSNPQTSKQGAQRLRLAMVASAAARLEGIVNHSFEGKEYGPISVGEFRRINLSSNGPCVIQSYVPKDVSDPGIASYQISNGSLYGPSFLIDANGNALVGDYTVDKTATCLDTKPTDIQSAFNKAIEAIRIGLGLEVGDQLTMLAQIYGGDGSTWIDGSTYIYPVTKYFQISRLEFTEATNSSAAGTIVDSANSGWTFQQIKNKNSADFSKWVLGNGYFLIYPDDEGHLFIDPSANAKDGKQVVLMSGATILSRKSGNKWLRSREILDVNTTIEGMTGEVAWLTYMKNDKSSSKYLNQGEQAPNIIGQNTYKVNPFDN